MKSSYNLVMSILGSVFTFIFLVLSIVFHGIEKDALTITFSSIFYVFIIGYFILNSIYYGSGNSTLHRLGNITSSIFTTLILIYFLLLYNNYSKWIFIGIYLLFLVFEILLDSFDKLIELKYLLVGFKLTLILYLFVNYYSNIILLLGISSVILYFVSRLLGKILNNKIILSYDIISLIIFGIFYIFI